MEKTTNAEVVKAVWFVHVVKYTAEELGRDIQETVRLLDKHGLAKQILSGYNSLHTQGLEYMAELLTDELRLVEGD
jgi:hypothetical protein